MQQRTRKKFEEVEDIFREHGGVLRAAQARALGIHTDTLYAMLREAKLVRENRGVYRLASSPSFAYPDLIQVALRVPKAVIALISALAFHDLTTQIPHRVYITLPRHSKKPRLEYPSLHVLLRPLAAYQAGIEEHHLDNVKVQIYNREKSIADCLRYENKVGKDVVLEALKEYKRQKRINISALMEYARINKVSIQMQTYLEILL